MTERKFAWSDLPRMPLNLGDDDREFLTRWFAKFGDQRQHQEQKADYEDSQWLETRINEFHDRALKVVDFPCIRRYGFVRARINQHPRYADLIKPFLPSIRVLDIGCCMGTEIRRLLLEGARPENLRAVELCPEFIQLGHEFFANADTDSAQNEAIRSIFGVANVFDPDFFHAPRSQAVDPSADPSSSSSSSSSSSQSQPSELSSTLASSPSHTQHFTADRRDNWVGAFDVVYNGSMLHLFTLEDQHRFLDVVHRCLRPGGVVLGRTTGLPEPARETGGFSKDHVDLHSVASLRQLLASKFGDADVGVIEADSDHSVTSLLQNTAPDSSYRQRMFMTFWAVKSN